MTSPNGHVLKRRLTMGRLASVITGVLSALFVAGLLGRLAYEGWSHTFDSAIYTRSLWGVAHGDMHNPLVDLHVLSIHFNLVLFVLAPLTRIAHPLDVLIAAQAVAWGATVTLASEGCVRIAWKRGADTVALIALPVFVTGLASCTPMIINPFLFDVRPDLIGVPLVLAGLLRAQRRGDHDVGSVLWMLSALLIREEYMMVVVGALLTTPFGAGLLDRWKLRLAGIIAAVGWIAVFWFGVRRWIGDGSYEKAQEVGSGFLDAAANDPLTLLEVVGYKVELLVVFAAAMGGLALLGWRWAGAAGPGLLFLLISSRMQHLVLNFHYVLFVTPGLVGAGVAGYRRFAPLASRHRWMPLAVTLTATVSFLVSAALPGGGRYRSENFALLLDASTILSPDDRDALQAMHDLVEQIPPDVPAAVIWEIAAPASDRAHIVSTQQTVQSLRADEPLDPSLVAITVPRNQWVEVAASMVADHGFRLVDVAADRLALLTRDEGRFVMADAHERCEDPPIRWPDVGLAACRVDLADAGPTRVQLQRLNNRPVPPSTWLLARPEDAGGGGGTPLLIHDGLVAIHQIAPDTSVVAVAPDVPGPRVVFELWSDGRRYPVELGSTGAEAASFDVLTVPRSSPD